MKMLEYTAISQTNGQNEAWCTAILYCSFSVYYVIRFGGKEQKLDSISKLADSSFSFVEVSMLSLC